MSVISYIPIEWDLDTPINVTNLNKMDTAISELTTAVDVSAGDNVVNPTGNELIPMQALNGDALKINYNALATAIIEQYAGSTLVGSEQSIQDAFTQLNTDTLTVTTTTASYASAFTNYNSDTNNAPHFWKVGKVVTMTGIAKPTAQIASGGSATMFTVPEGFRPITDIRQLCQGSNNHIWMIQLTASNGSVVFGRLRNGADATATSGTAEWLPFSVTYICE